MSFNSRSDHDRQKLYSMLTKVASMDNDENSTTYDSKTKAINKKIVNERNQQRKLTRTTLRDRNRNIEFLSSDEDGENVNHHHHQQQQHQHHQIAENVAPQTRGKHYETTKKVDTSYQQLENQTVNRSVLASVGNASVATAATNNRMKLLNQWREEKKKRDEEEKKKLNKRPIFKVYHLDTKEYETRFEHLPDFVPAPHPPPHHTSRLQPKSTDTSRCERPVTRSQTKKGLTSSASSSALDRNRAVNTSGVFQFGLKKSQSTAKFTFNMPMENQSAVGRSQSMRITKPPVPKVSRAPIKQAAAKMSHHGHSEPKQAKYESTTESHDATQYEDFCNNLCVPSDEIEIPVNHQVSDNVILEEEGEDQEERMVVASAPNKMLECFKEQNGSLRRSSRRSGATGVYNVDIQSSIIEFESKETTENVDENSKDIAIEFKNRLSLTAAATARIHNESLRHVDSANSSHHQHHHQTFNYSIVGYESIEMDKRDVKYYRALVNNRTRMLNDLSNKWLTICEGKPNQQDEIVPTEQIQGDIRSACGLAKLLIDERFDQFIDLVNQCEDFIERTEKNLEIDPNVKEVKCSDLQGFWDMVEYQVKDVENKFKYLTLLKDYNFNEESIPDLLKNVMIGKPAETKKAPIRPKLKKQTALKNENDPSSAQTVKEKKAPVRSKFAEFRAALKKSASVEDNNSIDIVVCMPEEKAKSTIDIKIDAPPQEEIKIESTIKDATKEEEDEQQQQQKIAEELKSKRKSVRKSIKPLVASEMPLKYNLRSRKSDLINFESPATKSKTLSRISGRESIEKGTDSPLTNAINSGNLFKAATQRGAKQEAKSENAADLDDDFFSVDRAAEPITWFSSRVDNSPQVQNHRLSTNAFAVGKTNSPLVFGSGLFKNVTPQATPNRARASLAPSNNRQSLGVPSSVSVINSPLLKLAYVSSCGKRLSLSNRKPN